MSLERFHTALPESLTIEQAVCAMIEGDNRIKLPMCYETIGLPFRARMTECRRILERLFDSACEFETVTGQMASLRQLERFDETLKSCEIYSNDLGIEVGRAGQEPDSFFGADDVVDLDAGKQIKRGPFIKWARTVQGVDVFGFQARRDGHPWPAEQSQAGVRLDLVSGEKLWQLMTGERPSPVYSDGEKLFLSMAWLLDGFLSVFNGEWRRIINDETDKTSMGLMINGQLNVTRTAEKIARELPSRADGKKSPVKAITGHIEMVTDYLTLRGEHVVDFSVKAQPMAFRTVYGLARALWRAKKDSPTPDARHVQYPDQIYSILAEGLTQNTAITPDDLNRCLDKAIQVALKLYAPQTQ